MGGERWWQVRGLDGIDAEWITEREYLRPANAKKDAEIMPKISDSNKDILRMEHLETVMVRLSWFLICASLNIAFHSFISMEVGNLCHV